MALKWSKCLGLGWNLDLVQIKLHTEDSQRHTVNVNDADPDEKSDDGTERDSMIKNETT